MSKTLQKHRTKLNQKIDTLKRRQSVAADYCLQYMRVVDRRTDRRTDRRRSDLSSGEFTA